MFGTAEQLRWDRPFPRTGCTLWCSHHYTASAACRACLIPRPRYHSPVKLSSIPWPHVYLSVALTTLATLLLELSLTRIFSVVLYYHFAFLAISIALFGLGAGGVCSYIVAGWKTPLFTRLGRLSGTNAC